MKLPSFNCINKKSTILLTVAIGLSLPLSVFAVSVVVQLLGELLFRVILSPFYLLLQIEMWLLMILAQYNNFINENGVVTGWTVLRDLANMFFILILLIISFATIIRAQGYGYKQTLSRLIIVAILINFSRMIVGVLIDFSQVIMLTFVQAFRDTAAGNLVVALGLGKVTAAGNNPMSDATYIQALFLGSGMLILAVVVIGAFIGVLAARIVKLWILTIMAPMAFLSYVLPKTQGFYNKWVSDLGRNLFSGPTLAFFLWLTFTITGRGDIHKEFLKEEVAGGAAINEVSAAASADNVINYVIAIALLAGSLQIVSASGAAGASVAGKASKMVGDSAAKLGRRYPLAMASRAGAFASRGIVNDEGEARKLFGKFDYARKIPFVGGRIERTAEKMQGYDAARVQKEHAEDTKYIKPTHLSAFYRGQETKKSLFGSQKLGALYSTVSSQGGNFDKDVLSAQTKVKRGEVDAGNAAWTANQLRRAGDEDNLQTVQGKYHNTFANEGEAMRLIRRKGIKSMITDLDSEAYFTKDKDGNVMQDEQGRNMVEPGVMHAMRAIHNTTHGQADIKSISKLLLGLNKSDRHAFDYVRENYGEELWGQDIKGGSVLSTNSNGRLEIGKRQEVSMDVSGNAGVIAGLSLACDYPNRTGEQVDPKTGHIVKLGSDIKITGKAEQEMQETPLEPGQVASRAPKMQNEPQTEFDIRKAEIGRLDESVWLSEADQSKLAPHLQGRFKTEKEFNGYRDDRYKQLLGLRPMLTDEKGKKLAKPQYWRDEDIFTNPKLNRKEQIRAYYMRHTAPKSLRGDLVRQTGLAKEDEAGEKARKELAKKGQNVKDFLAEVEKKVARAMAIDASDWDQLGEGFNPKTVDYMRLKAFSEAGGSKRVMHDLPSHSVWTEVVDGADGSRGAEVNVGNPQEAAKLSHYIEPMENKQQAQMYAVSVPDQTTFLLKELVALGKKPQKTIIENSGKTVGAEAEQSYNDALGMEADHLPQDYNRLLSSLDKLLFVMRGQARKNNMPLSQFLKKDENSAVLEFVKANINTHNASPDTTANTTINIDNIDNDATVLKMFERLENELKLDVQPHKIEEEKAENKKAENKGETKPKPSMEGLKEAMAEEEAKNKS